MSTIKVLVIAEHDEKGLKPATLSTVTAGLSLASSVTVFVGGATITPAATEIAKIPGVSHVLTAQAPELAGHLAEPMAQVLEGIAPSFTHILAPATTFGKNLMPRLAAKLDAAQVSDLTRILSADTFERPIYAGNAIATVQSLDVIKVLTIRPTAFPPTPVGGGNAVVEPVALPSPLKSPARYLGTETTPSKRPELTAAHVVVSGGRGLQNSENFSLIEDLADCLNAAIGASRAAVDAGFVPNDYQVGQTGKVVAPDLYIAIGISGAIQHLAGMKDSKVIIAINKDPDAPIFQVADFGLVGDLFDIVPQLIKTLRKEASP